MAAHSVEEEADRLLCQLRLLRRHRSGFASGDFQSSASELSPSVERILKSPAWTHLSTPHTSARSQSLDAGSASAAAAAAAAALGTAGSLHDAVFPDVPLSHWTVDHVQQWVQHSLSLPQYGSAFKDAAVDGLLLQSLQDEDVAVVLGITHPLHRRKLFQGIAALMARRVSFEKAASPPHLQQTQTYPGPVSSSWQQPQVPAPAATSAFCALPGAFGAAEYQNGQDGSGPGGVFFPPWSETTGAHSAGPVDLYHHRSPPPAVDRLSLGNEASPSGAFLCATLYTPPATPSAQPGRGGRLGSQAAAPGPSDHSLADITPLLVTLADLHDATQRLLHPQQVLRLFHVFLDAAAGQASVATTHVATTHAGSLKQSPANVKTPARITVATPASAAFPWQSALLAFPRPPAMRPRDINDALTASSLSLVQMLAALHRIGYTGAVVEAEARRLFVSRGAGSRGAIRFADFCDFVTGICTQESPAYAAAAARVTRLLAAYNAQELLGAMSSRQLAESQALRLTLGLPLVVAGTEPAPNMLSSVEIAAGGVAGQRHAEAFAPLRRVPIVSPTTGAVVLVSPLRHPSNTSSLDVASAQTYEAAHPPPPSLVAAVYFSPLSVGAGWPEAGITAPCHEGSLASVLIHMVDGWAGPPGTDPWYDDDNSSTPMGYNEYAVRVLQRPSVLVDLGGHARTGSVPNGGDAARTSVILPSQPVEGGSGAADSSTSCTGAVGSVDAGTWASERLDVPTSVVLHCSASRSHRTLRAAGALAALQEQEHEEHVGSRGAQDPQLVFGLLESPTAPAEASSRPRSRVEVDVLDWRPQCLPGELPTMGHDRAWNDQSTSGSTSAPRGPVPSPGHRPVTPATPATHAFNLDDAVESRYHGTQGFRRGRIVNVKLQPSSHGPRAIVYDVLYDGEAGLLERELAEADLRAVAVTPAVIGESTSVLATSTPPAASAPAALAGVVVAAAAPPAAAEELPRATSAAAAATRFSGYEAKGGGMRDVVGDDQGSGISAATSVPPQDMNGAFLAVGDRVEARWQHNSRFRPAMLTKVTQGDASTDTHAVFSLQFDEGDAQEGVPGSRIRRLKGERRGYASSGAAPELHLQPLTPGSGSPLLQSLHTLAAAYSAAGGESEEAAAVGDPASDAAPDAASDAGRARGTGHRHDRSRHRSHPREGPPTPDALRDMHGTPLVVGDRVLARFQGKSRKLYPGTISGTDAGTFSVQYDDGDADELLPSSAIERVASPFAAAADFDAVERLGVEEEPRPELLHSLSGAGDVFANHGAEGSGGGSGASWGHLGLSSEAFLSLRVDSNSPQTHA